ncbi:DUF3137 domain-containing protein [Flammeovirga aprica]|uniref:DUF3137 domain-containing protein n=1 Tax=Flammeovirga aprica JL-4 TaxID=694437 RepID=A0A7X9S0N7_9BACT|nr:DUF3137 domain-containing protein [Flammeovirga aprica]NME72243.1 DUF3137 domain-containing protein [Flammeovirga aprica JL-4]
MVNQEELNFFHRDDKLKSEFEDLERQRLKIKFYDKGFIISLILFFSCFGVLFLLAITTQIIKASIIDIFFIAAPISVISFGIFFGLSIVKSGDFRKKYKEKIVKPIVTMIDDTWIYKPEEKITQKQYISSLLYEDRIDFYTGNDLIEGVIEQTDFKCSELVTQYEVKNTSKNKNWHTTFRGLFFHADFNKYFTAATFVRTRRNGIKVDKSFKVVELEDATFSKIFEVRSIDQVEARYILTPSIMEAIVKLYQYYQQPIDISFVGNRVYCAVSFSHSLFEPSSFIPVYDVDVIHEIYKVLYFNKAIIHELNLNTRIWMKGAITSS